MKQTPPKIFQSLILAGFGSLIFWVFQACSGNATDQKSPQISEIPEEFIFTTADLLASDSVWNSQDSLWQDSFQNRYAAHNYQLYWFRFGEPVEYAHVLFQLCREGTEAHDIPLRDKAEALTGLLEELSGLQDTAYLRLATHLDLSLSLLFVQYARLHWVGLPEQTRKQTGWLIPGEEKNLLTLLEDFVTGKDRKELKRQAVYVQYDYLESWLRKYRQIEANGGWPKIEWKGKELQYGDTSEILMAVRQLLILTEDLSDTSLNMVYDSVLTKGVRAFQLRHGIQPTGVLGALTIRAMSYSVQDRINQILINQERCKWAPPEPRGKYIAVNIPDFKMMVFEDQKLQWSCNVVVGKQKTSTVIFSNSLQYVVFSPYWNVPRSILINEVLPALRKDPGYLNQQNMEVYAGNGAVVPASGIDWHQYRGQDFPYNIRQKPGRNNALGRVKFLFPNVHNIYLHDTPSKNLFTHPVRAFSHGCIRIQEPVKLAKYLLKDDPAWTEEKIEAALDRGIEEQVALKTPVPVFIAYFTAFVDGAGKLQFREDLYQHDHKLGTVLFK